MQLLVGAILVATLASIVTIYLRSTSGSQLPVLRTAGRSLDTGPAPEPSAFNCRVRLTKQKKSDCLLDIFTVEICGSIHALGDTEYAVVQISVTDITEGASKARAVQSSVKHRQIQDCPTFCYSADLGRLPGTGSVLDDWICAARIQADWLRLPFKGQRNLQFTTSILSRRSDQELAYAECSFVYENAAFGYVDLRENIQRTKTLAVALAFAVSAADNRLYDCEIKVIKKWALDNLGLSQASAKARRKLEKALNKTVGFFQDGNKVNANKICKEIVEIAPVVQRYEILELCMRVVRANGVAAAEELAMLKNLAHWLEVDMGRFRNMMEKILPIGMHEVEDVEVVLGITPDMSKEQTRRHLNKEYSKWNSRVTNSDPEIQSQADQMLRFIAEARSTYVR